MAEAKYLCPDCGSIDLDIKAETIKGPNGESLSTATCSFCSWSGKLKESVGVATTEQLWDFKRVAELLMRVMGKHAASPMIQCFEFIGILPKKKPRVILRSHMVGPLYEPGEGVPYNLKEYEETEKYNDAVQACRDAVMRRVFEVSLTAAFEEAERQHRLFAIFTNGPLHPMFEEKPDEVLGGDLPNKPS